MIRRVLIRGRQGESGRGVDVVSESRDWNGVVASSGCKKMDALQEPTERTSPADISASDWQA